MAVVEVVVDVDLVVESCCRCVVLAVVVTRYLAHAGLSKYSEPPLHRLQPASPLSHHAGTSSRTKTLSRS